MSGELEARVQRLEDLLAIQQLFVDYGNHLDAQDLDSYAALFADDGEVLLGPLGRAKGRDEIKALMAKAMGPGSGSFHLVTNPMITLDGDRASSVVMWTVVARDDKGAPKLTMLGRHVDELVRTPEGWRFARRKGYIDLPGEVPANVR
jgi:uncharacterized protein (TIGR02246 family)